MHSNPPRSLNTSPGQSVVDARERVKELEKQLAQARVDLENLESAAQLPTELQSAAQPQSIDPMPSANHVSARSSLEEKLELFSQRFAGRQDVYATRWVSRKTMKPGWSPAVKGGFYTDRKTHADFLRLTPEVLEQHLRGQRRGSLPFMLACTP